MCGARASGRLQTRGAANNPGGTLSFVAGAGGVFPSFEPIPRPTRTFFFREPFAGPSVESEIVLCSFSICHRLLHHFHEMTHFMNHAAGLGPFSRSTTWCMRRSPSPRIVARMSSVQPMKLTTHLIFIVPALFAPFFLAAMIYSPAAFSAFAGFSTFGGLPLISSTGLRALSATCFASFKPSSAGNVALTTLCGLEVPSDLVSTF